MDEIRLSQIDDSNLTDEQIDSIVFTNIDDDKLNSDFNSTLIKM